MAIIHDSAAGMCPRVVPRCPGVRSPSPPPRARGAPLFPPRPFPLMTDSLPGAAPASGAQAPMALPDADREHAFGRLFDDLAPRHRLDRGTLPLASPDASARRYFRVSG